MILQRVGSLKVVSNLNRFQRRLESPYPQQHLSFQRMLEPPHISLAICQRLEPLVSPPRFAIQSIESPMDINLPHNLPAKSGTSQSLNKDIVHPNQQISPQHELQH